MRIGVAAEFGHASPGRVDGKIKSMGLFLRDLPHGLQGERERGPGKRGGNDMTDHGQLRSAPKNDNQLVMKVTADAVTAKAQYPVRDLAEVEMPLLDWE